MDLAAEQPRDLPADRKPEARAAVLSTRGAVGLLEGLENNLLLARRNPDAGVADREGHDTIRLPEPEVLARPSRQDLFDAQGDHAMLREFDGVRQQVFQHLLQTHQIGLNGRGQTRHALDREFQPFALRHLPERAVHILGQIRKADRAQRHTHRARLDLREVQNVVDERQEVAARRIDRLGEFDLFGRQRRLTVVRQQLGQDQQAVERRAQLMRHVGKELRFVPRGQRQLLGLFFESQPRFLDLAVLHFHLRVLLRQQVGLLFQLLIALPQLLLLAAQPLFGFSQRFRLPLEPLVRGLELVLLALQLGSQRLRLFEEVFRPHVRGDRVQHDADAFLELIKEGQVNVAVLVERGELDDRLDLVFEQHRQHHDVVRRRLAEP